MSHLTNMQTSRVTLWPLKILVGTMEQVVAFEQTVLLMMVMLIKLILAYHEHKEMKIFISRKI